MKNFIERFVQHLKKNAGTHIWMQDRLATSAYTIGNNQRNPVLYFLPPDKSVAKRSRPFMKLNHVKYE